MSTFKLFKVLVATIIAGVTNSEERPELTVIPLNHPMPVANLPGCVHLATGSKLARINNAFSFGQWAHQCEAHNHYAGSIVEVNGSQAKMRMTALKLGPFWP